MKMTSYDTVTGYLPWNSIRLSDQSFKDYADVSLRDDVRVKLKGRRKRPIQFSDAKTEAPKVSRYAQLLKKVPRKVGEEAAYSGYGRETGRPRKGGQPWIGPPPEEPEERGRAIESDPRIDELNRMLRELGRPPQEEPEVEGRGRKPARPSKPPKRETSRPNVFPQMRAVDPVAFAEPIKKAKPPVARPRVRRT